MDLNGFDASKLEPAQALLPIPAGEYKGVITTSVEKPTKAQTGSYLELEIQLLEGEYKGRKVYDRLNLNNPNPQAVEIAQRTLKAICQSVGVITPKESSELHDKPLTVTVAVRPATDQYAAQNEVKGYKAAGGGQQEQAQASHTPPWKT